MYNSVSHNRATLEYGEDSLVNLPKLKISKSLPSPRRRMEIFQAGFDKEQVKYLCCCFWIRLGACKKFRQMMNLTPMTPPSISPLHSHLSQTLKMCKSPCSANRPMICCKMKCIVASNQSKCHCLRGEAHAWLIGLTHVCS